MIVGGLLVSTLLTLFVVPAAYTLLARQVRPQVEEHMVVPLRKALSQP